MDRTASWRRRAIRWSVLCAVVFTIGCGATRIGDILARPADFVGKDVTIAGEVTTSIRLPLLPAIYTVKDETGEIPVVASGEVRPDGTRVRVPGRVESAVTIGPSR